jgi:hypothetical protein
LSEGREGMQPSVECRERSTLDAHLLAEERGGKHGYIRKSLRRGEGQHEGGRHSREWQGTWTTLLAKHVFPPFLRPIKPEVTARTRRPGVITSLSRVLAAMRRAAMCFLARAAVGQGVVGAKAQEEQCRE